jgi:hypothetical protein
MKQKKLYFFFLTPQTFRCMFYRKEQALNSKIWLNVGVNIKSVLYSKQ